MSATRRRAGFTLPEALIALTIASVLILLVGTVFLVQNDFYAHVFLRSQVQENVRATTELIASELRSVTAGGFIVADSSRLVARSPMAIASICGRQGSDVIAHIPGGVAALDTTEIGGFGYRNPTTGAWSFHDRSWSQLRGAGGVPAQECYLNGADTTGATAEFVRLENVDNDTGITAADLFGATILLFRKTEFRFNDSALVPGDRALFWGVQGTTLKELVTGVAPGAHFEFRTGASGWSRAVSGGTLANIDAVRVDASSMGRGQTSAQRSYDFSVTLDIPLANAL